MVINIWSDIRCPFCYIGKRKFETALERFAHKDKVAVIWRSFQLDPSLKTRADMNAFDYLAKAKGVSHEQSVEMHERVRSIGHEVGLTFNFDKVVVANSFNGHRLIQLANTKRSGHKAEEALFKAHFTDGKNIDAAETILEVGRAIDLPEEDIARLLSSDAFTEEVKQDELLARSIGIRAVPFFIFNDHYAISGAQSHEVFLQMLEKAWREFSETLKTTRD